MSATFLALAQRMSTSLKLKVNLAPGPVKEQDPWFHVPQLTSCKPTNRATIPSSKPALVITANSRENVKESLLMMTLGPLDLVQTIRLIPSIDTMSSTSSGQTRRKLGVRENWAN